jgi:hypothetical protein
MVSETKIAMRDCLEETISKTGVIIAKTAATPATKDLIETDNSSDKLTTLDGDRFHSVVAKLLYVATQARMDLLLSVGFLTTRVSRSTQQEDICKLNRLLEYGTLDVEYVVGADHLGRMRTWVNAAYAVHPDMRGHTGGVISF